MGKFYRCEEMKVLAGKEGRGHKYDYGWCEIYDS